MGVHSLKIGLSIDSCTLVSPFHPQPPRPGVVPTKTSFFLPNCATHISLIFAFISHIYIYIYIYMKERERPFPLCPHPGYHTWARCHSQCGVCCPCQVGLARQLAVQASTSALCARLDPYYLLSRQVASEVTEKWKWWALNLVTGLLLDQLRIYSSSSWRGNAYVFSIVMS